MTTTITTDRRTLTVAVDAYNGEVTVTEDTNVFHFLTVDRALVYVSKCVKADAIAALSVAPWTEV